MGVRFKHYSLGRSAIANLRIPIVSHVASRVPVLSLKIKPTSLGSVSYVARSAMFASGALCSMLLPFIVVLISFNQLPSLLSNLLLVTCLGNLIFDVYYSPKAGDISRIKTLQDQ